MRHANSPLPLAAVSFRLRQAEVLLPTALAAVTAWLALLQMPRHGPAWLAVLLAVALASWCRSQPARSAWLMALRALVLLGLGLALQASVADSAYSGRFDYWNLAVCVGYALLLPWPFAVALSAVAVGSHLALLIAIPPAHGWPQALAMLGMLLAFAGGALQFARTVQRSEAEVEASLTDNQTGLYNTAGFLAHGEEVFQRARRDRKPVSLAILHFQDLRDVSQVLGRGVARRMFLSAVGALTRASRGQALAARTGREEFALLLPGMDTEQAKALLQSQLGQPPQVQLELRGRMVRILLDSAVLSARDRNRNLEDLYDHVARRLQRKRAALLHRGHPAATAPGALDTGPAALHSGPGTTPADLADTDRGPLSRLELNPTLPMALTAQPDKGGAAGSR